MPPPRSLRRTAAPVAGEAACGTGRRFQSECGQHHYSGGVPVDGPANTAIFSLIDAVMLRMLPVREPARLLQTTRFLGGPPGIPLLPAFRAATRIERTATRTADTSDLRGLLPPPPRRPSWQRPAPSEQPLRGRPRPGSEPIARRTGGRQPGRCRGQPKPSDRRLIAEGYPCRYPAGIGAASAVSTGSLL